MTYMNDGKTTEAEKNDLTVDESAVEGDGFETVYPPLRKKLCGRVLLKTHFSTIKCEMDPGHPPPCEGKGIRR